MYIVLFAFTPFQKYMYVSQFQDLSEFNLIFPMVWNCVYDGTL